MTIKGLILMKMKGDSDQTEGWDFNDNEGLDLDEN